MELSGINSNVTCGLSRGALVSTKTMRQGCSSPVSTVPRIIFPNCSGMSRNLCTNRLPHLMSTMTSCRRFRGVLASVSTDFAEVETSQEELERIKAFKLPDFVPPYPSKTNPYIEKAKAEAYRWAEEFSIYEVCETPEKAQTLYKSDIPSLTMMVYTNCGEKEIAWVTKFYIWGFLFDDRMDDIANFSSPEKSMAFFSELNLSLMWSRPDDEQFYNNYLKFLDVGDVADRTEALDYFRSKLDQARLKPGTAYDNSSPSVHLSHRDYLFCKAFRHLLGEVCETMPDDFLRRWALTFQNEWLANVMETRNRKHKTIMSVDDYIVARRNSSGILPCIVIVEFLDKVHLPDEVFDCSEMQRFLDAANDIISWHNDLWSFQKEALIGDVHNLVTVISHAEGCSYAEAGTKVYQMMLYRIEEMEKAISDLEMVTPPEYQHAIAAYSDWARTFVTGVLHALRHNMPAVFGIVTCINGKRRTPKIEALHRMIERVLCNLETVLRLQSLNSNRQHFRNRFFFTQVEDICPNNFPGFDITSNSQCGIRS